MLLSSKSSFLNLLRYSHQLSTGRRDKETSKMRFLCLHGRGTNSDIFESQLGTRTIPAFLLRLIAFFS
jgi:hypothetical protein